MNDLNIEFPLDDFEELISQIGWSSLDEWFMFWNLKKEMLSINNFWDDNVKDDWIWGLALPLLSQAYKLNKKSPERKIIGISALPGTGKTTLGKWLESISLKLKFKLSVISIDDFYLPSEEMEFAIKNNPWNVSRGFPGSHSIDLMKEKLLKWKTDGQLNVPVFDKSLRKGLGDRAHWREESPDLLIIEGWFLGVKPLSIDLDNSEKISPPLSVFESSYRNKIQNNLDQYLDVWNMIDQIWHLKPLKFEYFNEWKSNQEKSMQFKSGSSLKDDNLSNFLRMLNVSIPHKSFDDINSDVLLMINQERKLIRVGLNQQIIK
jgi:D-glycerate 3-kinase